MFLRQSTSQIIRFGPFVDSTDGVTAETGLTIAQADMQLSKDGAAFAQKSAAGNATHDTDGWYSTTLSTTDTGTVGELYMQVVVAGALPVWIRYWVIEEVVYDDVYGAAAAGPAVAGDAMDLVANAVDATAIATGAIDADAIATDAITSAKIAADAIGASEIATGAIDADAIASNAITSAKIATDAIGAAQIAANAIGASELATDAVAEIADAVWDEDIVAAHGTADTSGEIVSQLTKRAVTFSAEVIDGSVLGQLADDGTAVFDRTTDSLQAIADSGGGGPTAAVIADAVWDEDIVAAHGTADTGGEILSQLTKRSVTFSAEVIDGSILGQIADDGTAVFDRTTDSLQALADGGGGGPTTAAIADAVWDEATVGHTTAATFGEQLATDVDAILVDTNSLNDTKIPDTISLVAINAEVDTAISDAALATAANLATVDTVVDSILVDTDTTIPGLISGLNDPTSAAIADAVWDEDIVAAHGAADTGGEIISQLTKRSVTFNTEVVDGSVLGQLADDGTATFDRTTDSLQAVADSGGGGPTAATIADAVWDESTTGHVTSGTFGEQLKIDVDAILVDTGTTIPGQITGLNDISVVDILTTQMTESYAADGVAPTLSQALSLILQQAGEFSISGTTLTVRRLDGSATAATFTLNDATDPTSRTRAS